MRGKVGAIRLDSPDVGITPAYAGKRSAQAGAHAGRRDHPRVCGEKQWAMTCYSGQQGSPPRMRGKVLISHSLLGSSGITPAYAGKSNTRVHACVRVQDHPRVCGEKLMPTIVYYGQLGSPPRMRGKGCAAPAHRTPSGITPAYAGKSCCQDLQPARRRDHPRVCGEKPGVWYT